MVGGSAVSRFTWVVDTVTVAGRGGNLGQARIMVPSTTSGVVMFMGDWSHGCHCGGKNQIVGPDATAAQLPVDVAAAAAQSPELCAPPLLLLSGSLGLQAQPPSRRTRIAVLPPLFPQFCLFYEFISTHLQMYKRVDLSSILMCWAAEPLLNYACFTSYRQKGRGKGTVSYYHNADITVSYCVLRVLHIVQICLLANTCFANVFLQSLACLLTLFNTIFLRAEVFNFDEFQNIKF